MGIQLLQIQIQSGKKGLGLVVFLFLIFWGFFLKSGFDTVVFEGAA